MSQLETMVEGSSREESDSQTDRGAPGYAKPRDVCCEDPRVPRAVAPGPLSDLPHSTLPHHALSVFTSQPGLHSIF